jgi:HK97 family phage major capsid protein
MPDMTVEVVGRSLAESLGLDLEHPEKNDTALVSEYNATVEKMRNAIAGMTNNTETPMGVKSGEMDMLADTVRQLAEELKQSRASGGVVPEGRAITDPNAKPKTTPEIADDLKAGFNVWEEGTRRGIPTFSSFDLPTRTFADFVNRPSVNADTQRFHEAQDSLLMAAAVMGYKRAGKLADGSTALVANVLQLNRWQNLAESAHGYMSRALNITDEANWVPTEMSGTMIEKIYEATAVMQLLPRIDFPLGVGTMDLPTEGADVNIYLTGEATEQDGDAKITAAKPGVGKVSLTPKVLATRMVTSQEMTEDSAIAIGPYMVLKMQRAFSRDLDDIIINGDTTATHHDTGYTVAANDRRRAWTGLIEKALTDSGANSDCAVFNVQTFMKPTILMAEYADDETRVICIMNRSTLEQLKYLVDTNNNPVYLTATQWGVGRPPAQAGSSVFTDVGGYRVVKSAKVNRNLNASGVYDNSVTSKSLAIWAHLDSWLMAVKRDMRLVSVEREEQLQRVLVGSWRGILASTPSTSTDYNAAISYDIPNGS